MVEAFKVYRGKYIIGIGIPYVLVAGGVSNDVAYIERFLFTRVVPMKSYRINFPKGFITKINTLLDEWGLEDVISEIEDIWLGLPANKKGRIMPDIDFREVKYINLLRLKESFMKDLKFIQDTTQCKSLKKKLKLLLSLELQFKLLS